MPIVLVMVRLGVPVSCPNANILYVRLSQRSYEYEKECEVVSCVLDVVQSSWWEWDDRRSKNVRASRDLAKALPCSTSMFADRFIDNHLDTQAESDEYLGNIQCLQVVP